MNDLSTIQGQMDEVLEGVKAAQNKVDTIKERMDGITEGEIKSIQEKIEEHAKKVEEMVAEQKATAAQNEKLEKLICNMGKDYGDAKKQIEEQARNEFTNYLRTRKAISDDVVKHIVDDIVEKSNIGITSEKKEMLKKDLQVQVDPDGGYWVRPELSDKMITRIFETSPVRQHATVTNINSDALEFIIDDNEAESGGWVGESEDRGDTDTPQTGQLTIYAHEQFAQPKATQKMLDDAGFDIEAWLQGKITRKFTRVENTAFVKGNGVKKPRGFMTYPAWSTPGTYERGAIEQRISSTIGSFEGDDFKKLQADLIEDYQPNAIWMMKRATFTDVAIIKDGNDRYLLDTNSFKVGDTLVLLGKPVVFMHDMDDVANDALPVAYGDLSVAYTVVDRIGIRVLRDPYTKKGFLKYYSTKRVGGDVTSYDALKILKIKSS